KAAERSARQLNVPLLIEDFTPTILNLLAHPKHGFGAGMNPCIDCHIAMVRRAGELMQERGCQFISTGEVLNQRPMSQHRQALQRLSPRSAGAYGSPRPPWPAHACRLTGHAGHD
ncbi:MAG: hypothetical protein Q8O57_12325, partial [Kiritimatiellota bacterium]|nr:hypothetical protein [Kiritimatiellota bacterium]